MEVDFRSQPNLSKQLEIESSLIGYWQEDKWYFTDPVFEDFPKPKFLYSDGCIDFSIFSPLLKNEIKFYFVQRVTNRLMRLSSLSAYKKRFRLFNQFLSEHYCAINSFIEIPINKAITRLRTWLLQKGYEYKKNATVTLLRNLYDFYQEFYDPRDEYEKDIWNFRKIPGTKLNKIKTQYSISFMKIPRKFRSLVKRYMIMRTGIRSIEQCRVDVIALGMFFTFINEAYPKWSHLNELNRLDIESYLIWYRNQTDKLSSKRLDYLVSLRLFLEYIQKAGYSEAPNLSVGSLLFREDFPQKEYLSEDEIKFISEGVIQQLEDNLDYLRPKEYIPVVILLRASGWRISDILNLRYDNCLQNTKLGWYLCGDIVKTNVKSHRVPISEEVAAVIQLVIEETKRKTSIDNNPNKLLFVRFDGPRKGNPPLGSNIRNALNRLAQKYNIVDDNGDVFHFGNHAFRHTKAVELINNGMNILHVQKWLAHASPEMTLRYAKILDTTMRESWEKATKQGLFRVNDSGEKPKRIDLSEIENEDLIEWEYIRHNLDAVKMELGYCMKPIKQPCPTQANPCLSCRNFCTTPDFIPQYESEIKETKEVIERGKALGRKVWIEKNEGILNRLVPILEVLKEGRIHHQARKKGREYVDEERQAKR